MDKIFLRALKTEAIIGIFDWERQVKQTVILDIEISADIRKAALSDSIDDTLNYKRVAKRVLAFVEESKFHLVETLAEHIAMLILQDFGIAWVRISLSKPGAIRSSRAVGVSLERDRNDLAAWHAHTAAAKP
jgi:7,8-dihydroneopterin aldolase/epimerase/oxygenase